ncbi:hypothetical protein LEN26_012857 [Aphanomyces euteiches]|nr:hypothetical protein AeMF1_015492 [Aphanomyces euteiches]KAH9116777.1 hypothetical protein LEN26_012857 [Aphanomyces euteiches]KAH9188135.1 hypothetical protein AeNC1_009886 [Aphanomyces euteiches]
MPAAYDPYCPTGMYSVSVVGDKTIRCVSSKPCSGVFNGLERNAGACPTGSSCGVFPSSEMTLKCIKDAYPGAVFLTHNGTLSNMDNANTSTPLPTDPSTLLNATTVPEFLLQPSFSTTTQPKAGDAMQDSTSSSPGASKLSITLGTILEYTVAVVVVCAVLLGVYFFRRRKALEVLLSKRDGSVQV